MRRADNLVSFFAQRLLLTAVLVGTAIGAGVVVQAGPGAAQPSNGAITASPNVSTTQNDDLYGVSCTGPSFCMSVDYYENNNFVDQTLAETWNGSSWTISLPQNTSTTLANQLFGVSCTSPSFCMAVGHYNNGTVDQTLAETWNGSAWTMSPSLDTSAALNNYLLGVSCTSPGFCAATGFSFNGGGNPQTLAETWNGSTWTINPTMNVGSMGSTLDGVSCTSPSFCMSVGHDGNSGTGQTLEESFNGSSWTLSPPVLGAVTPSNALSGVSCTSPSFCAAVGSTGNGGSGTTLAETWNGNSWTINPSQNSGSTLSALVGVSCTSTSICEAVGIYYNGSALQTLAETWNGSSWTINPSPNTSASLPNELDGVACTSSGSCIATGSYENGSFIEQTLAETLTLPFASSGAPPSPPVDLTVNDGPITLNWDPPVSSGTSPVTSYEVFRFTSNTAATLVATVQAPTTTYVDQNVTAGLTYSYYVEATNVFGTSPPSNVVSITATSAVAGCGSHSGNAAFVCTLYEDILGRAPDSSGLSYWQSAMSAGTSTTQVAYGIATSSEYRTGFIQADYQAFLGRPADPGGLSTWMGAFNSGATDEQIDAGILGSAEFFSDSGGTNNSFVNALYQDLLGRPADSGGLATWNQALSSGVSRTQVAYDIDTSNESRTDTVQFFYQTLLGRPADPGGLSTWVGALNSGATDEQVLAGIAGSQEFYNDSTGA